MCVVDLNLLTKFNWVVLSCYSFSQCNFEDKNKILNVFKSLVCVCVVLIPNMLLYTNCYKL